MNAILISGSRNPKGQTARALDAVAAGLRQQNVATETLFLPAMRIERCRQCDDNGWGLCRQEGRCVIEDDFPVLVYKLRCATASFSAPRSTSPA
jgi:multimeric flavodoxin WrbA